MLLLCNTGSQTLLLAQPQRDAVPVQGVMSNVSFTSDKHVERQHQSVYSHYTSRQQSWGVTSSWQACAQKLRRPEGCFLA